MKNNVWVESAPALVKEDRGSGSATINNIDWKCFKRFFQRCMDGGGGELCLTWRKLVSYCQVMGFCHIGEVGCLFCNGKSLLLLLHVLYKENKGASRLFVLRKKAELLSLSRPEPLLFCWSRFEGGRFDSGSTWWQLHIMNCNKKFEINLVF